MKATKLVFFDAEKVFHTDSPKKQSEQPSVVEGMKSYMAANDHSRLLVECAKFAPRGIMVSAEVWFDEQEAESLGQCYLLRPGAFLAAAVWGGQRGGHICIDMI